MSADVDTAGDAESDVAGASAPDAAGGGAALSPLVVARKDYEDAVRSKTLWVVTALFVLLTGGVAYFLEAIGGAMTPAGAELTATDFVFVVQLPGQWLIPLVAVLVGYKSVVAERESGTIKLLLSLPHTRRTVLLGKLAGRLGVVATAIVAGFAVAGVVVAARHTLAVVPYLVFVAITVVYAAAFVGLAVGFSAAVRSGSRAVAGAFGIYALFGFNPSLWDLLPFGINYVLNGEFFFDSVRGPEWAQFVSLLSPKSAYNTATAGFVPGESAFRRAAGGVSDLPIYLSEWAALVVLGLWLAVPMAAGYWRFQRADL